MTHNEADSPLPPDFNRREFIKGASVSSLMLLMGGIPLHAEDKAAATPADTGFSADHRAVNCGVIGCGNWGREIIQTLALVTNPGHGEKPGSVITPVTAICDNYPKYLNRAKALAPNAAAFDDYHKLLEQKDVEAVIIATPTHLHREIVEAAFKAGKHVYCEAPLAHTVEDALAIAKAAKANPKLNFQSGLQMRADPAKYYVLSFMHNGAVNVPAMGRGQWHKKDTMRRASSDPAREKALNWFLDKNLSAGLAGEFGIHQYDLINWFLNQRPVAVNGFGAIMDPDCRDGREVADTIQTVLQYPTKFNFVLDCTLASHFDDSYTMIYGNYATLMMREGLIHPSKSWLFQEAVTTLLGWEPYAAKEKFHAESGITLSADASHSIKVTKSADESPYLDSPLHHALKAFGANSPKIAEDSAAFYKSYGNDADDDSLREYLAQPVIMKSHLKAPGYEIGYEATVIALKANEAVVKGEKVMLPKELFDI